MSQTYRDQIVKDKHQNSALFTLFVFTILGSLTAFPAILTVFNIIYFKSALPDEPLLSFTLCSCSSYPIVVALSLAAAWYWFVKKRYSLILPMVVLPLLNFFIALIALAFGY